MVNTRSQVKARQEIFGDLTMPVDGSARHMVGWEEWAISAFIDAGQQWREAYQAIRCHKSQLASYGGLDHLTDEQHHLLWGQRAITGHSAWSTMDAAWSTICSKACAILPRYISKNLPQWKIVDSLKILKKGNENGRSFIIA